MDHAGSVCCGCTVADHFIWVPFVSSLLRFLQCHIRIAWRRNRVDALVLSDRCCYSDWWRSKFRGGEESLRTVVKSGAIKIRSSQYHVAVAGGCEATESIR